MSDTDSGQGQTHADGVIEVAITPKLKDLGGFSVRRVLPALERRRVGPFVFFDHMGPAEFPPGKGISVRPHPHIGLATITYLFDGLIMHRDSLGFEQPIRMGAVNLMTAGRGIVHSERAGDDLEKKSYLHGIQSWMALPTEKEEIEPAFVHYPADTLPELRVGGVIVRIIMGHAFGHESPVTQHSPTLYLECRFLGGGEITLPDGYDELAVYVATGSVEIDGEQYNEGTMAVVREGHRVHVSAPTISRVMILGGDRVGERHLWWNFVSSSKARIEQAKQDWQDGRFEAVPGDDEFIPLP